MCSLDEIGFGGGGGGRKGKGMKGEGGKKRQMADQRGNRIDKR